MNSETSYLHVLLIRIVFLWYFLIIQAFRLGLRKYKTYDVGDNLMPRLGAIELQCDNYHSSSFRHSPQSSAPFRKSIAT